MASIIDQYLPSYITQTFSTPDPSALAQGVPVSLAKEYAPAAASSSGTYLILGGLAVLAFLAWRQGKR